MSKSKLIRDKYPELQNYGKSWTNEEEIYLLQLIKDGKTNEELSKEFRRTKGGIIGKLRTLACNMITLGKTIEYAMEKTQLSKTDIEEQLIKRNISSNNKINTNIKETIVKKEQSEMKEVIDLMKEIRDLLKKFVESVELT